MLPICSQQNCVLNVTDCTVCVEARNGSREWVDTIVVNSMHKINFEIDNLSLRTTANFSFTDEK